MRILFLGSPEEVIPPLQTLFEENKKWQLIGVVSQAAKEKGRGKTLQDPPVALWAKAKGIPVYQPLNASDSIFLEELRQLKPDLMITAAYGQILSDEFLSIPTRGTINIHPSLLPKYRGATPIPAAILAGEQMSGVSILFTVRKMDAGAIILQEQSALGDEETALDLTQRLFSQSCSMLRTAISMLEDHSFIGTPQNESAVTHCRKINKEAGSIIWTQTAKQIFNQFRAFFPWPGSFLSLGGQRIIVESMGLGGDLSLGAGEFQYDKTLGCFIVGTAEGNIQIRRLKPQGKSSMEASAFWNGIKSKGINSFDQTTVSK